jgi:hypothetical protein
MGVAFAVIPVVVLAAVAVVVGEAGGTWDEEDGRLAVLDAAEGGFDVAAMESRSARRESLGRFFCFFLLMGVVAAVVEVVMPPLSAKWCSGAVRSELVASDAGDRVGLALGLLPLDIVPVLTALALGGVATATSSSIFSKMNDRACGTPSGGGIVRENRVATSEGDSTCYKRSQ